MTMCRNERHDLEQPYAVNAQGECAECKRARDTRYRNSARGYLKRLEWERTEKAQDTRMKYALNNAQWTAGLGEEAFDLIDRLARSNIDTSELFRRMICGADSGIPELDSLTSRLVDRSMATLGLPR